MATYERRGDGWRAKIRLAGHPAESRTFDTRTQARAWAEQREEDLRLGRASGRTASVRDALARYARDVSKTRRGARWERLRLDHMAQSWPAAKRSIGSIAAADIAAWRDARLLEVAPATVAREWNLLRSVFERARKEWGMIAENPMRDVERPKSPPARRRRVSQREIDGMVMALGYEGGPPVTVSDRVALAWLLAIETAMRAGEIEGLRWQDVQLADRFVRLPRTKNGDAREVPLSSRAVEIIKLLPRSGEFVFGIAPGVRDALFRKARGRTKIDDLHFHDSRAEAIWRMSKKLDVLQLARAVGQRDIRSLMFYFNEPASDLAKRLD